MSELREKDIAVLQAVHDGASTTSEIQEATTLTTREINYSLTEYSLEELDLIQIDRAEGREWQEINGHEKNIWRPKQVELTDHGIQTLTKIENEGFRKYEDLDRRELIERIHQLEQRQERLENAFKDFRRKVMEKI